MDREELGRRLMISFLGEAEDRIDALNEDLLALETEDPGVRGAAVQRLFRSAHSLKGAARAVGLGAIESLCHRMEDLLAGVRDGTRALDKPLVDLCFAAVDAVATMTGKHAAGEQPDEALATTLLARLDAAFAADQPPAEQLVEALAEEPVEEPVDDSVIRSVPEPSHGASSGPTGNAEAEADADAACDPATEAAPDVARSSPATLRVAATRVESLLDESGELVLAHRRVDRRLHALADITEQIKRQGGRLGGDRVSTAAGADGAQRWQQVLLGLEAVVGELRRDERSLGRIAGRLNRTAQAVRMTPFASACRGLARVARDVASDEGKRVELTVEGGDVELDRFVVERLRDPLLHLVRNAVGHGLETPSEREAAGKPPIGRVTLRASLRGDTVQITVTDDGRGVDHEALRARAEASGLAIPDEDRQLEQILFQPGFTTAQRTTRFSGRGVGLDVVKSEVEALHGSIDLDAAPGGGCRFALMVPLTLTAIRALLVASGGRIFALPSATVIGLARIGRDDVRDLPTGQAIKYGERLVPLRHLGSLLGLGDAVMFPTQGKQQVAIVGHAGATIALAVDELQAETEILVKELGPRLEGLDFVSGATVLEHGGIALILNAPALARTLERAAPPCAPVAGPDADDAPAGSGKRLLVADDSVTTRMLLIGVLEGAGYDVCAVPDGMAAWERLQRESFDLVVSDVEMPRMDGFGLTERLRSSAEHRALPLILVTGLEKEEQRLRGLAVGANAYLVKSGFESHSLLETIETLV